ncbi:MAG: hypothetical protein JO227_00150 [Acetobacteraceae bacterium]|nr:hypothetical protein [Acetobacteraceae bacterium]
MLASENRLLLPAQQDDPAAAILTDPQTSGGLLAGVPPEKAESCLHALHAAGVFAAIIGVVETDRPEGPQLRLSRA